MGRFDIGNIFAQANRIGRIFDELPSKLSKTWSEAVVYGWYPAPHMPGQLSQRSLESQENIDIRMLSEFEDSYIQTKEFIICNAEQRIEILTEAFKLHEGRNYIACIPLLLSQADGIFSDLIGVSVFTRREELQNKIEKSIESKFDSSEIAKAYFSTFSVTTQFHEGSNSTSDEMKTAAPNRNGILHGDINHLDYGTHPNSCKSINFLASALWLKESYKQKNA